MSKWDSNFLRVIEGLSIPNQTILEIKKSGCPLVMAEQNLKMALDVGDRHYIIDNGIFKYHGTSDEIRYNEEVKKAYLGVGI